MHVEHMQLSLMHRWRQCHAPDGAADQMMHRKMHVLINTMHYKPGHCHKQEMNCNLPAAATASCTAAILINGNTV